MYTRHLLVVVARGAQVSDGVADRIAVELGRAGLDVELAPPASVGSLDRYDAVVLGSELVDGRWHVDARALAQRIRDEAPTVPLWLFSSHRSGHPSHPRDRRSEADELAARTGAREHREFAAAAHGRRAAVAEAPGAGVPTVESTGRGVSGGEPGIAAWAASIAEQLRLAAT